VARETPTDWGGGGEGKQPRARMMTYPRRHANEVVAAAATEFRQHTAESTVTAAAAAAGSVAQPALHRLEQLHRLGLISLLSDRDTPRRAAGKGGGKQHSHM